MFDSGWWEGVEDIFSFLVWEGMGGKIIIEMGVIRLALFRRSVCGDGNGLCIV